MERFLEFQSLFFLDFYAHVLDLLTFPDVSRPPRLQPREVTRGFQTAF